LLASEKTAALIVASEYIDATYGEQFGGEKIGGRSQIWLWPRRYAYDIFGETLGDTVPREVEQATYQLAMRQGTAPGSLSGDFNAGEVIKRAKVEGAVEVEYAGSGSFSDSQSVFPVVDGIIAPVLTAFGSLFSSLSGSRVRV
jgi:hypothetical protein